MVCAKGHKIEGGVKNSSNNKGTKKLYVMAYACNSNYSEG
jgi:hypothetical protein